MPQTVLKINLERYNLEAEAILVIDKMESGVPAKGGIRVLPDLKEEDCILLAREMTIKNAISGLPFGGGKGGIRLANLKDTKKAMYAFGRELAKLNFIPYKWCAGPDLNTDCADMDAFMAGCASVIGWRESRLSITGKTSGIPHEVGSTAYGVVLGTEIFIREMGLDIELNKSTAIIEGIGEVGGNSMRAMMNKGVKIVGTSDSTGGLYLESGLNEFMLLKLLDSNKKLKIKDMKADFPDATYYENPSSILEKKTDILLLASPGKTITVQNAGNIKAKLIVEGSNIAYENEKASEIVFNKGIYSIPSVLINAGGVVASYVEWRLESENMMYLEREEVWDKARPVVEERITANMMELCSRIKKNPERPFYMIAKDIYDDIENKNIERNKKVRIMTRNINRELEEKYEIFTK